MISALIQIINSISSYHIFDSIETHCSFASTAVWNICFSLPPSHHTRGTVVVGPLDVEMLAPQDVPDTRLIFILYCILLRSSNCKWYADMLLNFNGYDDI